MPINWRLAAAELRYLLEHSEAQGAGVRRRADRPRRRGDQRPRHRSRPQVVRVAGSPPTDGSRSPSSRPSRSRRGRQVRGDDIHRLMYTSGTTGRPEGRDAHPRQPGVEELRPHHRVRLHVERRRARVRAALPRRCARPRHDHDDRGRCDHDHPPHLRRRARRRRDRAIEGHDRVDGAGDAAGGARPAGHRGARSRRRCG